MWRSAVNAWVAEVSRWRAAMRLTGQTGDVAVVAAVEAFHFAGPGIAPLPAGRALAVGWRVAKSCWATLHPHGHGTFANFVFDLGGFQFKGAHVVSGVSQNRSGADCLCFLRRGSFRVFGSPGGFATGTKCAGS